MEIIHKYFEGLTKDQLNKLERLHSLFIEWNEKINLISRKDTDHLFERHILHSLSIAKFIRFNNEAEILDLGTGGGFPGLPLAILFPQVKFTLVDSIGKKIKVVNDLIDQLKITNACAFHRRVEEQSGHFDFVITRAVAQSSKLITWSNSKIKNEHSHEIPNGIIALKGGDLTNELEEVKWKNNKFPLSQFFDEPFFETKVLIHLQLPQNK